MPVRHDNGQPAIPAGMEAVLTLDGAGRVRAIDVWPWAEPPRVDGELSAVFEADSAQTLGGYAARDWVHVAEQLLVLKSGETVRMWVSPEADGVRVALRDVSAIAALNTFSERRRRNAALARLSASLARELSDPMSVVLASLEVALQPGSAPDSLRKHVEVAFEHTRRVTATLHNLRTVGRFPGPSNAETDLRPAIDGALVLLGARGRHVEPRLDREDLQVGCAVEIVAHVCASLLRRTLDALGPVPVQIAAAAIPGGAVEVLIGPGARAPWEPERIVEDGALDHILLSSVGGSLAASRTAAGPRIRVTFPQPVAIPRRPRPANQQLLVVGANIGAHVEHVLSRDGYTFAFARTVEEALPLVGGSGAVLVELVLDGAFSGTHLAEVILRRSDGAGKRVVLVADGPVPPAAIPRGAAGLCWPASRETLLAALGRPRR